MKKFNLLGMCVSMCLFLNAQLQINGSVQFVDFEVFNQDLANNSFPTLDEEIFTFSVIGTNEDAAKVYNRNGIIFNQYTRSGINNVTSDGFNELNLRSIGILSGTGFNILKKENITFGPSIDVLIVQNRLRLIENLPSDLSFNNVISRNVDTEEYRNIRWMFDGRLNLRFKTKAKEGKASYGIGLTGGYRWDPFQPEWRFERSNVRIEIPDSNQTGFVLGILITIKGPKIIPPRPKKKQERS
jgi:hypothetical protein